MAYTARMLWGIVAMGTLALAWGIRNGSAGGADRPGSVDTVSPQLSDSDTAVEAMSSTVAAKCADGSSCGTASSELVEASKRGKLSEVQRLLSLGTNVEETDEKGASALYWAMLKSRLPVAEALISAGANVNASDVSGWTPLHWVSFHGSKKLTEMLITRGVNVREVTTEKQTRWWGNGKRLYYHGSTALEISATNGHLEIVQILLDQDALSKAENAAHGTPLHMASMYGHTSVARALIDAGAKVNEKMAGSWTPLHIAATYEVAQVLLDAGADPEVQDANEGTPLLSVGTRDHFGPAKALIVAGANTNAPNRFGWTPLHAFASDCTNPEALKALIAAGADVSAKAHDKSTPLYASTRLSTRREYLSQCIEILVAAGANVDAKGSAGWTPLHWAAYNDDEKLIETLISNGAHKDVRSTTGIHYYRYAMEYYYHHGSTPLHVGAMNGHAEVVKGLLEHGANKEEKNQDGLTPRDVIPEDTDDREYLLQLLG